MKKRWEDQELLHINRMPACTTPYYTSAETLSLAGEWKFLLLEAPEFSPENFMAENMDDASWQTIKVPGSWQLQGFDNMHYTDVLYLFPLNPPYVPDKNPTGIYRRKFTLEETWIGNCTKIRFNGVDSAYDVWVNGRYVGYGKVSRLPSEFDLTDYVRQGENQITVRVYKWSDGSYLEDQDMWWLSGIFRDVILYNEPRNTIEDVKIKATMEDAYKVGSLNVEVRVTAPENRLRYEVLFKGKILDQEELICQGKELKIQKKYDFVLPWTAETPNLYDIRLSLIRDGKMIIQKEYRTGFRTIEIIDNNFTVNGKVIFLNGVNHHDFNPVTGRTMDKACIKEDIILMKRHNINAVRCSHYPSEDYLYDLCDEYGLYVIDETDLECHGFEWAEDYKLLSDGPSWQKAYVDRVERMILRDYNHPCILMWSLGNESSFGCNFKAMAERVRQLDAGRLIHYEGDTETEIADVYSTMYTHLDKLIEIGEGKTGKSGKPHIMCEYGHAMGNGPGGLKEYQAVFRKYKRLQGGFIWEWYDHGIRDNTGEHDEYYYGGDFGDFPTNGNFCIDGLLRPDRKPSSGLLEYKEIICPVQIVRGGTPGEFLIKNQYDFLKLSHLYLRYSIVHDDITDYSEKIDLPDCKPGEIKKINLFMPYIKKLDNTRYYLNMDICYKYGGPFAKKNFVLGERQFFLPQNKFVFAKHKKSQHLTLKKEPARWVVENKNCKVVFNTIYGKMEEYGANERIFLKDGPELTVYRACIDNDMYKKEDWLNKYFIQKSFEKTEEMSCMQEEDFVHVRCQKRFGCMNQRWGFRIVYDYFIYEDGSVRICVSATALKHEKMQPAMLPRIGLIMQADKKLGQISWSGLGPGESYCDSREAVRMGQYRTDVEGMQTDYVYPQENGHREQVYWLSLSDGKASFLMSSGTPYGYNVHDYTEEALENAGHLREIKRSENLIVHLDYKHSGLGSNSCGEEQLEAYRTKIEDFNMEFMFRIVEAGKEKEAASIFYED